jgi:hypothetical protein
LDHFSEVEEERGSGFGSEKMPGAFRGNGDRRAGKLDRDELG